MARTCHSLKSILRRQAAQGLAPGTLQPRDVAGLYGLDALYSEGFHGQGERLGFVEFAKPNDADDAAFWATDSLAPGLNTPVGCTVVDGSPDDPGALGETDLDLQYAGALAPAARLWAYLVSDRGSISSFLGQLYDALYQAAEDGVRIVSVSLGTSDRLFGQATDIRSQLTGQSWPDAVRFASAFDALVQSRGLLVFASSGDSGAYGGLPFLDDRPQPIWPAIQPSVVAVGGTQLTAPGDPTSGEQAWGGQLMDATLPGYSPGNTLPQASGGGGVSSFLAAPGYQSGLGLSGRATPDIAAFAGPLRVVYQGQPTSVWGTSASAPIAAAVCALVHQATGRFPTHADLYGRARDIRSGNNWNSELAGLGLGTFYTAKPGYDLCTGMGTPVAAGLLA
jgi:kumamolisin